MSKYFFLFFFLLTNNGIINATELILNPGDFIDLQVQTININVHDTEPLHIHSAGKPFQISVEVEAHFSAEINYQWLDYQGKALSKPVRLNSHHLTDIKSPDSIEGYYGLSFSVNNPFKFADLQFGENREYGFAILKQTIVAKRSIDMNSAFGVVHAKLADPALPAWIKTLTWKTYSPRHWKDQILKRNQLGLSELPMIVGYEWESDDTKVISNSQLTALGTRIKKYFNEQPEVLYWELGREENLKKRFRAEHYWDNLEKKIKTIRKIANEVNPKIKFIYQIAGLNLKSISKFAKNKAAKQFDILSLHPYAWPDFIAPEKWLTIYLENVDQLLKTHELDHMPIWFTEVGVPHQGNYKGGFFGYPKSNKIVKSHTRKNAASYMVKLHVLALSKKVQKIFWYNYKDRRFGRQQVENHFGLVDFWGYPKPAYVAYMNLVEQLNGKQFMTEHLVYEDIQIFEFKGSHNTTWVAWCYPNCKKNVSWSNILSKIRPGHQLISVNLTGTEIKIKKDIIQLTDDPIFIKTNNP